MTTDALRIPLNIFQRIIRQWEEVHPYNGAQALVVTSAPPAGAIESAWNQALLSLGLGMLHVDDDHTYHYKGLASGRRAYQRVPTLPADVTLDGHLSAELNLPFADHDFPFRPFVLREPGRCHLGAVYRHWAADSVSIRLLLQEWFARLFDPAAARAAPARQPDQGYWGYFGPTRGRWGLATGMLGVPRTFNRFRHARRVRAAPAKDPCNRFTRRPVEPGLVDALRAAAHGRGAHLHDLFLAAAAVTCRDHLPFRDSRHRRDIAVGSIVDLRPYSAADLSDTFGLFLGFSHVFCAPDDFRDFDRLVRHIADQTRRQKLARAPASGIVCMGASLVARRLFSPNSIYPYYRKHMPLAGGISDVCLDRTFAARHHPSPLLDYVRASPTGPMVPLAFTPTTLGSHLSLGLTCYEAQVPDAPAILAEFVDRLVRLV